MRGCWCCSRHHLGGCRHCYRRHFFWGGGAGVAPDIIWEGAGTAPGDMGGGVLVLLLQTSFGRVQVLLPVTFGEEGTGASWSDEIGLLLGGASLSFSFMGFFLFRGGSKPYQFFAF